MAILFANNASTTISGSITPASTTVQLAAGTGVQFPNPTSGNYYVATFYDQATKSQYEIVHVTAMSGDTATIVRAQEGTTANNWTAGDIFANLVTAQTLANFVQAGTGPADTSIVYVGTDVSTTPNLIVCNTNPVPAGYATGMQFNIKVKNTNTGATNLQLNGLASKAALRTDGSALVGGNLAANQEAIFIWNGTAFNTTRPPIPTTPPQTVFYVRPDGNDNNSGFANTSTDAFATVQGAMNAIKARYISQNTITIRVADGFYSSGFGDVSGYIASWDIIGNEANPGNVVINATSTNAATYVTGAPLGSGCGFNGTSFAYVRGFTFQSYYYNAYANGGGILYLSNCHFTCPTSGINCIQNNAGACLSLHNNIVYSATATCVAFVGCFQGAVGSIGFQNIFLNDPVIINFQGTPTFSSGTVISTSAAACDFVPAMCSWTGVIPTGPRYYAGAAGGISLGGGGPNFIPGTSPGVCVPPGWVY